MIFFYYESKLQKKKTFFFLGGGGGGGGVDGRTDKQAQSICSFNFFEIEGITMHKCTSYGPDKLNLWPFYHLTFKCDPYLQPT